MKCPERARLEEEQKELTAIFEAARARLQSRMGISPKREYDRLDNEADVAWQQLNKARKQLHEHLLEHGCAAGGRRAREGAPV